MWADSCIFQFEMRHSNILMFCWRSIWSQLSTSRTGNCTLHSYDLVTSPRVKMSYWRGETQIISGQCSNSKAETLDETAASTTSSLQKSSTIASTLILSISVFRQATASKSTRQTCRHQIQSFRKQRQLWGCGHAQSPHNRKPRPKGFCLINPAFSNESLSSISRLFPTQFTGKSFRCLVTLLQLVLGNIFIFRSLKKSSSSSCSSQILPTSIVTHQMRRDLVPVLARAWANAANAKLHFVRVAPLAYDEQLPTSQK